MILIVAKVVDLLFVSGTASAISDFLKLLNKCFTLRKIKKGMRLKFLGCHIQRKESGSILMSVSDYIDRIHTIDLSKQRRNESSDNADDEEKHYHRILARTIM